MREGGVSLPKLYVVEFEEIAVADLEGGSTAPLKFDRLCYCLSHFV